jgi:hypothetical protein
VRLGGGDVAADPARLVLRRVGGSLGVGHLRLLGPDLVVEGLHRAQELGVGGAQRIELRRHRGPLLAHLLPVGLLVGARRRQRDEERRCGDHEGRPCGLLQVLDSSHQPSCHRSETSVTGTQPSRNVARKAGWAKPAARRSTRRVVGWG